MSEPVATGGRYVRRFHERSDIPDQYQDLMDYRMPFLAYGGPAGYIRTHGLMSECCDAALCGNLNHAAAEVLVELPEGKWPVLMTIVERAAKADRDE